MTEAADRNMSSGIYPSQWIRNAIANGTVTSDQPIESHQVQPNSLDLRISPEGYRVQCSFLPGSWTMADRLKQFKWYDVAFSNGCVVLEPNQVYVFRLMERLALPEFVEARANPKSSTGRLDVFTRITVEGGKAFDQIPRGYVGPLYLEIVPRSFAVLVRPGDSFSQLRFQVGTPTLSDEEVANALETEAVILTREGVPLRPSSVPVLDGIHLSVRIAGSKSGTREETIGYRARRNTPPIDVRKIGEVPISAYWYRIYARKTEPVILEPDEFYIFSSNELVRLPPAYCAEMVPFDAGSGEVRTHYAGFFDSGFGFRQGGAAMENAAAVVLEVRNRDVPFLLEHGQRLFRLLLMRTTEHPDVLYGTDNKSNYQRQRLRLAKQFAVRGPRDSQGDLGVDQESLPWI